MHAPYAGACRRATSGNPDTCAGATSPVNSNPDTAAGSIISKVDSSELYRSYLELLVFSLVTRMRRNTISTYSFSDSMLFEVLFAKRFRVVCFALDY